MLQSISPYALLCASKPKPTPTIVTAYDLYSQAQCGEQTAVSHPPVPSPVRPAPPAVQPAQNPPASARRTHYIADIKARHSAAIRRAPMQNQPLT